MNKYRVRFVGRKALAIGIKSTFEEEVETVDIRAAILQLYETYDHVSPLEIWRQTEDGEWVRVTNLMDES